MSDSQQNETVWPSTFAERAEVGRVVFFLPSLFPCPVWSSTCFEDSQKVMQSIKERDIARANGTTPPPHLGKSGRPAGEPVAPDAYNILTPEQRQAILSAPSDKVESQLAVARSPAKETGK
ncbi:hypothetical protein JCM11641_003073 [Rhodosporidiobolus odoratus]